MIEKHYDDRDVGECDVKSKPTPEIGVKHDSGKVLMGVLAEFKSALTAVAAVGTFGARKYSRGNWVHVNDAKQRYFDAMWRHLMQDGLDEESGHPHIAHFVWNALAYLELEMKDVQRK